MKKNLKLDIKEIIERTSKIKNKFYKKKILIVGSQGFLGKYFIEYFSALFKKNEIYIDCIDNFITGTIKNTNNNIFSFHKADISSVNFKKKKYDFIIYLAGIASPYYYRKYPLETLEVSYSGLKKCLDLTKNKKSKLIFFSSSEIYGDPDKKNIPTKEIYRGNVSSYGPRSCYDEGKRIGETLCYVYKAKFKSNVCIIRPFNVYGPGMSLSDYRVIPNLFRALKKNEIFNIYGSGKQTRSYCYVTDAIVGFLKVILFGRYGEIYNIGNSKQEINLNQLVKIFNSCINVTQKKVKVKKTPYPKSYPEDEPNRRCPDINKAKKHFNFRPKVSLNEGLKRIISLNF